MPLRCDVSSKLGALFEREQWQIASRFAEISCLIPRWSESYQRALSAGQLDAYIAAEFLVYPQYLAMAFATGDSLWLKLYIGEKKKQGYATDSNFDAAHSQISEVINQEIAYLMSAAGEASLGEELARLSDVLNQVRSVVASKARRTLKILWIADCIYLDIRSFLAAELASEGLDLQPDFVTTKNPIDRYEQASALVQSGTYDAIFYCPFSYENSAAYVRLLDYRHAIANTLSASRLARDEFPTIEMMLRLLSQNAECPIIVHNASGVLRQHGGVREAVKDALTRAARMSYCRTINPLLDDLVGHLNSEPDANRTIILDEFSLTKANGLWNSGAYFHDYGQQHPARLGMLLKDTYLDTLWAIHNLQRKKVVVCDLDNTLWRGIIGEGPVDHYLDRQSIVKSLKDKGILLAANSKNNPQNVTWDGANLGEEDFACTRINWQTKAENIGEIAEEMNLSGGSFVFIDDRADERAIVSSVYPEILTLDANDPAVWRRLASWAGMLSGTPEMDRTQMYRERQKREAFVLTGPKHSTADLFAQLELKCTLSLSESKALPRITELINRTNQFNTTGRRTSLKEVTSWHEQPEWAIYTATAGDRFGDMGLVGALVVRKAADLLEIEVFVLSCRVFGYGIETALLQALTEANSDLTIGAVMIPTPVNQPCRTVYSDHHFRPEGDRYIYDHTSPRISNKPWLNVDNKCPQPGLTKHTETIPDERIFASS